MDFHLFNTLTRRKEVFRPLFPDFAGIYTCGPTVYNYAHIGNLRTFLFEDVLVRALKYNEIPLRRVMNITDVGHLTGDRDMGEDKLEKGAQKEGKTAWELAEFYTEAFKKDMARLNILEPDVWCKATDTIPEQIDLIRTLEENGFTYRTSDGVYFDTLRFPNYGRLSNQNLDSLLEGARVERNPEKRNSTDFALWKFSPKDVQRQMEWDSPWGKGFPGWHVECSAMAMKYLDDHLDIHCGGTDHIDVHHTNEIAQSEAATGKPFFHFWMHGAFLQISGGKKMAKSADNFLTLENALEARGIDPLAYRYAAFLTHYRNPMEYSDESIQAAENGLNHLRNQVRTVTDAAGGSVADRPNAAFLDKFRQALNDDLNMPRVMAVVQETLKAEIDPGEKLAAVLDFDRVLGFRLDRVAPDATPPAEIQALVDERIQARREKNWGRSDELRDRLQGLGYTVQDGKDGMKVFKG